MRRCSALHSNRQLKLLFSFFWKSSSGLPRYHIDWASSTSSFFRDIGISKHCKSDGSFICSATFWIEIFLRLFKTCFFLIRNTRVVFDGSVKERWRLLVAFIGKYVWLNIPMLTFIPGVRYLCSSRLKNTEISLMSFSDSRDAKISFISWLQFDSYSTK